MRHDATYRPTAAPYDAQNAVLRITGRVFARARDVQQSVKKMNPLARLVRRLHIDDALVQLALVNKKKAARALYEVRSARCVLRAVLPAHGAVGPHVAGYQLGLMNCVGRGCCGGGKGWWHADWGRALLCMLCVLPCGLGVDLSARNTATILPGRG